MTRPTTVGFWLLLGFAAGMLASDITDPKTADAVTAMRYEEFCMVTGRSSDNEIDNVWILDYDYARLACITMNRNGVLGAVGTIDLREQFDLVDDARLKPRFMMVTGAYNTLGFDLCYIAEISTGQLLAVAPPFTRQRRGIRPGAIAAPEIVSRTPFRPEGELR